VGGPQRTVRHERRHETESAGLLLTASILLLVLSESPIVKGSPAGWVYVEACCCGRDPLACVCSCLENTVQDGYRTADDEDPISL
jgi:hypothetical protein